MKTIKNHLALFFSIGFCVSASFAQPQPTEPKTVSTYAKAAAIDSIFKQYAPETVPGISLAVYTKKDGLFVTSAGYADIGNKIAMTPRHLQYLQSVSKMYIAVEILQLSEKGKINIGAPMTDYLPKRYGRYIKNANDITVRMLLNHTSGINEYNENPEFLSHVLLHPLDDFSAVDCLKAIEGRDPLSAPGAKYRYINTNYLLLALIGDAITGDHAKYIRDNIFKPLGLNDSYYANSGDYLKGLKLPESYWDVFNSGLPIKMTALQQMTVRCSKGDDGIVCTTTDAVLFMKGLMEGKLLKPDSMKQMMDFVKDEKGNNRYGMGMIYFDLDGTIAYRHGGGGIGAGCKLMYLPEREMYIFVAVNLGVFSNGILPDKTGEMLNALTAELLR